MTMLKSLLLLSVVLMSVASCIDTSSESDSKTNSVLSVLEQEQAFLVEYQQLPISVTGQVRDKTGAAIASAQISIKDSNLITTSDAAGFFIFEQVTRENIFLEISASGFRSELIPIYLQYPANLPSVALPAIILNSHKANSSRMLFGGDVALGRRFLDPTDVTPSDQIPADNPDALILASDPEPGTRNVLSQLRPYYQQADWGVLNLETPVTDAPNTPHPTKSFVFFTLPKSLAAIDWLGVDYVSLGNNHVFDYLDAGLTDTINHLNDANILFSGAGLNSAEAFLPLRQTINNHDYGFLSMTSVTGAEHASSYVAEDNKAGAADLTLSQHVTAAIQNVNSENVIPIVQYHTGKEYTFEPSSFVQGRIQLAVDEEVPLLVVHHPHVAQGVGVFNNTFAFLGLGNLAFDQARLETMLGVMGRVDIEGYAIDSARLLPVYLEAFVPKLVSGRLASDFLRRLGEFSHDYNGLLYPYNGHGWVSLSASDNTSLDRTITVDFTIPESGIAVLDLREWQQWGESFKSFEAVSVIGVQMGRDLLQHGDFEDWDTDTEHNEAALWDTSGKSSFICMIHAYGGTAGLCSVRGANNSDDSVVAFRNRIRVMGDALNTPNKDLSLFGYYKGENAGDINIVSRYYASAGDLQFGEEIALTHTGGSFDWQPFVSDLNMPADEFGDPELDARAVRLFLRHSPPVSGDGMVAFDEMALIGWENTIEIAQTIAVPHAKDFLKVTGEPGVHQLSITFSKIVPAGSQ